MFYKTVPIFVNFSLQILKHVPLDYQRLRPQVQINSTSNKLDGDL